MNDSSGRAGPLSRWALLDIAPTCAREVALVPCDGCRCERRPRDVAALIVGQLRPHDAFQVSVPGVVLQAGLATRRRYVEASAAIVLCGCERECPTALLSPIRAPEATLRVDELAPQEAARAVAFEVDRLGGYPDMAPGYPFHLPLAARAQVRRFEEQPAPRISSPPVASGASTTPAAERAASASVAPTRYFDAGEQRGGRRWLVAALALALLLGGGLAYRFVLSGGEPPEPARLPPPPDAAVAPGVASLGPTVAQRADGGQAMEPPPPEEAGARPAPAEAGSGEAGPGEATATEAGPGEGGPAGDEAPGPGWIGGGCARLEDCRYRGALCLRSGAEAGFCSRQCTTWCPDAPTQERTPSKCVDSFDLRAHVGGLPDLPRDRGRGFCMLQCDRGAYPERGCPPGMSCVEVPLRSLSFQLAEVCVPEGSAAPAQEER